MSAALFISYHLLLWIPRISSTPISTPPSSTSVIPYDNITALNNEIAPGWVPSANNRGTADLLYSCAITLTLCVYTAIHLNIPGPGEPRWKQYLRKAKWAAIGIFAPEVVLFTAWQQSWSARKLCRELNVLYKEHEKKRKTATDSKQIKISDTGQVASKAVHFDLVYGFYAVMGGVVLNVSDMHHRDNYFTLSPDGWLSLAKDGHIFPIADRMVKDKSKADVLAKGLVCFQVTWLLVQCVARKATGYPISLLELHTFVHVICALTMYALWFKKPFDVNEPTAVDGSAFRDVLAKGLIDTSGESSSFANSSGPVHLFENRDSRDVPLSESSLFSEKLVFFRNSPAEPEDHDATSELGNIAHQITVCIEPSGSEVVLKLCTGKSLENGLSPGTLYGYFPSDGGSPIYSTEKDSSWNAGETVICPLEIHLTRKGLLRWRSLSPSYLPSGNTFDLFRFAWHRSPNFNIGRSESFNPFNKSGLQNQWILVVVLSALLFAYGGVHLLAWDFRFPSSQERLIWRIAGLYLAGGGVTMISRYFGRRVLCTIALPIAVFARRGFKKVMAVFGVHHDDDDVLELISIVFGLFGYAFLGLVALGYVFCRFYLVVESFLSVRHLPIGVYAAVPWANYIPHL